ncbi:MAG: hypothetical protein M1483_00990 [Actinobacteria bacterium]|nr:hypothetical protein [Actinomycetota bacterium]MCL6104210.1 hypothetical protein [Actinomycetota bacterium]
MSNVIQALPSDMQEIFVETMGAIDPELLLALQATDEPTRAQRMAVLHVLSTEFCRHLQADNEPTERGKLIDNTLGAFLLRWPIKGEATS